jgi:hypothetical protein
MSKLNLSIPRAIPTLLLTFATIVAAASLQPAWATDVCGSVCDETWTAAADPYVITCDVTVSDGCYLVIDAGVEVRSEPGFGLAAIGTLMVNGTAGSPVTFASNAGAPQAGDWQGLVVFLGGSGILSHVNIEHADTAVWASRAGVVQLDHVIATHNNSGLKVFADESTPTVVDATACTFTQNVVEGVYIEADPVSPGTSIQVTVTDSSLHSNDGAYDVVADRYAPILKFRGNWWGSDNAEEIASRIDGQNRVDWCGFLDDAPPLGSPVDVVCPETDLPADTTDVWSETGRPYLLTTDVHVDGSLQIEPGVEVRVAPSDPPIDVRVEGALDVNGTPGAPVTFLSNATAPQAGDWRGLEILGTAIIEDAEIFHADHGIEVKYGATGVLDRVRSRSGGVGLWIETDVLEATTVTASACEFTHNEDYGVEFVTNENDVTPSVTINGSSIHNNLGPYDFYVDAILMDPGQIIVDARYNYWGTNDSADIASRIYDRSDDPMTATVDWCGYLEAAGDPPRPMHCPDGVICDETEVWDQTDGPYLLISDVNVCPSGVLQIEEGVEVRAVRYATPMMITIDGGLAVNGTLASPVTLRSDAPTSQPGDWTGIQVRPGAWSTMNHAAIQHAVRGLHVFGDVSSGSTATLHQVTAEHNIDGLFLYGDLTVDATDSLFIDNQRYGVYVQGAPTVADPSVTIGGSEVHSNLGSHDFYLDGGFSTPAATVLMARNNWWGTDLPGTISARIRDRVDSPANAKVDWCGYLDNPGGTPNLAVCPDLSICDATVAWLDTTHPYLITSDVVVCPTGTLEVGPGVEVRVAESDPPIEFTVEGMLQVNGTLASPVRFTSDADTPQPEDWSGLRFTGIQPSTLTHATIEYGSDGIYTDADNAVTLNNVTLQYNDNGIFGSAVNGTPFITASGCSITDNDGYGVYLYKSLSHAAPEVKINRSSIHSNGANLDYRTNGFSPPYRHVLNARENWWGHPDPAVFGPRIGDHRKNNGWPLIDWCRYLNGPGGDPVVDAHCPDLAICDETALMDLTDKPYQITSDLYVCDTGTLQIGPGVELWVAAGSPVSDIHVDGVLDVDGTSEEPVILTSDDPIPQVGDWFGVRLAAYSTSTLDHAEIEFAERGIHATDISEATLNGVSASSSDYGLYVHGYGPISVTADDSAFTDNAIYGVLVAGQSGRPNPDVTIHGSSIHSNLGAFDYYAGGFTNSIESVVDARGNYWGAIDTETIGSRIRDVRTGSGGPVVDWCRWLDANGDPVHDVNCPDLVACDGIVTWDLTDKPYDVVSNVYVCPTGTLEIGPGVEARMAVTSPTPTFRVQGLLDVDGTWDAPVILTSTADAPQVSDWDGIRLEGSSVSTLSHAEISYAAKGIYAFDSADATLYGVTARENGIGLDLHGYGPPSVRASGCSFTDNYDLGVYVGGMTGVPNPTFTITGSSLHSNRGAHDLFAGGFQDPATSIVWATDNWWGTTDEEQIHERIRDHADHTSAPHVYFSAFGEECDPAIGGDVDGDGRGDFEDNCPAAFNGAQVDSDGDGMGDACDPEPLTLPSTICDGVDDDDDYCDSDGDGWGDPCDHQPTRADSNPDAPELCDARDNDGDGALDPGEQIDDDLDEGVACGDCDDLEPLVHVCACEECSNVWDDDCDGLADAGDPDCVAYPSCVLLDAGAEPWLAMDKGECGGATLSGPFDVIRGQLAHLQFAAGHVDLGPVDCIAGGLDWDRVTDHSVNLNPRCVSKPVLFYLGKNTVDPDYGAASTGEPRDTMEPDPACP